MFKTPKFTWSKPKKWFNSAKKQFKDFLGVTVAEESLAADIAGSAAANELQLTKHKDDIALQKEFAQHGIKWRVDDAVRSGLHPLAALGANVSMFQATPLHQTQPDFSGHGQNISRATLQANTILAKLGIELAKATVRGKNLDNAVKAKELGIVEGQPSSAIVDLPKERVVSQSPGIEHGVSPLNQYVTDDFGVTLKLPTKETAESLEQTTWRQRIGLELRDASRYFRGIKNYFKPSKQFMDYLIKSRPKEKYNLTHEYRFNAVIGDWVRRKKKHPGDTRLWDHARYPKGYK